MSKTSAQKRARRDAEERAYARGMAVRELLRAEQRERRARWAADAPPTPPRPQPHAPTAAERRAARDAGRQHTAALVARQTGLFARFALAFPANENNRGSKDHGEE